MGTLFLEAFSVCLSLSHTHTCKHTQAPSPVSFYVLSISKKNCDGEVFKKDEVNDAYTRTHARTHTRKRTHAHTNVHALAHSHVHTYNTHTHNEIRD